MMNTRYRSFTHYHPVINLAILCFFSSLSFLALAHQNEEKQDFPALVDIATSYQTTVINAGEPVPVFSDNWSLWRFGKFVEILKAENKIGERWELLRNDQLAYTWSSHPDKFSVLHTNSSLSIIGESPSWQNKATLINRALLNQLEKTGDERYLDIPAERYKGLVNDVAIELLWLESLQIPAVVVQKYHDQTTRLQLKEVYPFAEAPWQPPDTNGYYDVDYTDIGDHEAEPLVQKYVRMLAKQAKTPSLGHQHQAGSGML